MKRSPKITKNAGFTIIETLIVLAIAGVILLIVFIAVPTLERNARNGQRKADVATILQAVSHYELADSGNFPQSCGYASAQWASCLSDAHPNGNDPFLIYSADKLTYYERSYQGNTPVITFTPQTSPNSSSIHVSGSSPVDRVDVYNFERCSTDTPGSADSAGASSSDVVALYAVETGNTATYKCEQL